MIGHSTGGGEVAIYRPARHELCGQGGADGHRAAVDARNGGKSGRIASRCLRRIPKSLPGGSFPLLPRCGKRTVFRFQSDRGKSFPGSDSIVVDAGNDVRARNCPMIASRPFPRPTSPRSSRNSMSRRSSHGDDDKIVPIGAAALKSVKLIPEVTLKIYPGARTAWAIPARKS